MMSTQPALAAHASVYHNYGLTEVLFGRAAENFTGTVYLGKYYTSPKYNEIELL